MKRFFSLIPMLAWLMSVLIYATPIPQTVLAEPSAIPVICDNGQVVHYAAGPAVGSPAEASRQACIAIGSTFTVGKWTSVTCPSGFDQFPVLVGSTPEQIQAACVASGHGTPPPTTTTVNGCPTTNSSTTPVSILQGIDPNIDGLCAVPKLLHNAVNIALFLAGALAVIMFIYGGIRYVLSNGNPANTKSARETLLYSVIGLAVSSAAFAILNFVIHIF